MSSLSKLLSTIEIEGELSPVSTKRLNQFEKEVGIRLPASYREYCKTFEPGRLRAAISIQIAVPGNEDWPTFSELKQANEYYAALDQAELEAYCPNPEIWRNALFFGADFGGTFLWNRNEVTDKSSREMMIYVVYRDMSIDQLCSSFDSFIFDICMEKGVPKSPKMKDPPSFVAGYDVA